MSWLIHNQIPCIRNEITRSNYAKATSTMLEYSNYVNILFRNFSDSRPALFVYIPWLFSISRSRMASKAATELVFLLQIMCGLCFCRRRWRAYSPFVDCKSVWCVDVYWMIFVSSGVLNRLPFRYSYFGHHCCATSLALDASNRSQTFFCVTDLALPFLLFLYIHYFLAKRCRFVLFITCCEAVKPFELLEMIYFCSLMHPSTIWYGRWVDIFLYKSCEQRTKSRNRSISDRFCISRSLQIGKILLDASKSSMFIQRAPNEVELVQN